MTDPVLLTPDDPDAADPRRAGGKAAALATMRVAGLPIPPWVVVPTDACPADLWARLPPPDAPGPVDAVSEALAGALARAVETLGPGPFAVRSSAAEEDGAAHAFAGQFASVLGVAAADVPARVVDVWRSAKAPHVAAYRDAHGLGEVPGPPAVLVQALVAADLAGVAFSADPVSGARDVVVVAAVRGLGTALVDGTEDGETLRIDPAGRVLDRQTAAQRTAEHAGPDGLRRVDLAEPDAPVLSDALAADVAALARRAEAAAGRPQDIEWAIAGGTLWLLQSRPITALPEPARPSAVVETAGRIRLWDNSNIAESYGGVTTPMTFSFARRAYTSVYQLFCRLLGVPEARIVAHADMFGQMIGLVEGRVYYNLASWYQVLALLPGYRTNAAFMEGMMGVKEGIPDALRPDPPTTGRVADALALAGTAVGLARAAVRLPATRRAFLARLDTTLVLPPEGLDGLDLDGLAGLYRRLERDLLGRWDAPLVNDFFAMIAFGVAQKLGERWVGPGALGGLLAGDGDVISAEPARRIRALAEAARADPDPGWPERLLTDAPEAIRADLAARPAQAAAVDDYLARFGDRCLDELKLESPTLADDPTPLFRAVGGLAVRGVAPAETGAGDALRTSAEARMRAALDGHPLRRFAFGRALGLARARVRDRENLRFERTRAFGLARRLVVAMGARLAAAGRLDDPRDVFFLEIGELLAAADGTATTADLAGLARVRTAEFDRYRAAPAPPDRLETRGAVVLSARTGSALDVPAADGDDRVRTGLGCCPGVVEGPVRVVRDPRGVTLLPGTILVAERTDPGWVLLFPACAGLVVERGSLLSHAAIVARELGLPAAVSVPAATSWLADGDRVRLDGATGRVERLDPEP